VIRTGFFLLFGFFAGMQHEILSLITVVFPVPHMALLVGFGTIWPVIWRESIMGFCYTVGAIIYVTRIPEKILPGQFDLSVSSNASTSSYIPQWAASHVIWHYFTIAAALVSYATTMYLYFHRNDYVCT
jgi:predicted membrane channel-forming protein YqfA (hemolysin III family)